MSVFQHLVFEGCKGFLAFCFGLVAIISNTAMAQNSDYAKPPVILAKTQALDFTKISITTPMGQFSWTIELADDDRSRQIGLMNRPSMKPAHGMLFRFERTEQIAMWMKNTFIPLDMVFLDEAGRINHIHRGAVPQSLEIIRSGVPARFVLEINAGEADATGLKQGQSMKHPWFNE